jgi:hypothetical protein
MRVRNFEFIAAEDRKDFKWHKQPLAIGLLFASVPFLFYWGLRTPSPGKAVAAMAVVAAAMSLRGEMSGKEKLAWTLLLFGFLGVEIKSIDTDRSLAEQERASTVERERRGFDSIAKGIENSISNSDREFRETMQGMNGLLSEQTGGSSYLYFEVTEPTGPLEVALPGINKGNIWATAFPHFVGTYPLNSVFVSAFCPMGWLPEVNYGSMFPKEVGRSRQGFYLQFPMSVKAKDRTCSFFISTSNGSYFQSVHFVKLESGKWTWASRLSKYGEKTVRRHFSSPGFPKEENW